MLCGPRTSGSKHNVRGTYRIWRWRMSALVRSIRGHELPLSSWQD